MFGLLRAKISPTGRNIEVGEYSLHLQCSWRVVRGGEIVVASGDQYFPADEDADWITFDPETAESRLDHRVQSWIESHPGYPVCAGEIRSDSFGGFELPFEGGSKLQVFPNYSLTSADSELWRIFRQDSEDSDFVMLGGGARDT